MGCPEAVTGLAGMVAGVLLGLLLGKGIGWSRRLAHRSERPEQRSGEEHARKEREERATREIAEKGYSWETPTLCPHCGKAQPSGRSECSEYHGGLRVVR